MKCILMPFILFTALLAKGQTAQSLPETKSNANDKLLMAVAWYQYSAEMEALYYQGFNIASQRLDEAVAADTTGKPLAIIVDIDETMLNNSPFEAVILNGGNFQSGWSNWVAGSIKLISDDVSHSMLFLKAQCFYLLRVRKQYGNFCRSEPLWVEDDLYLSISRSRLHSFVLDRELQLSSQHHAVNLRLLEIKAEDR